MITFNPKGFDTFDRRIIRKRWRRSNKDPIKRAGLLVRKIMRQSIRRDQSKAQRPSKAGRPPKSRAAGHPLKLIFSVTDRFNTRAIVGPVGFSNRRKTVPQLMEEGGIVTRRVFKGKRTANTFGRKISSKQRKAAAKKFRKKELAQQQRDKLTKQIVYPARPFAVPALEKGKSRLPALWKNSIKR